MRRNISVYLLTLTTADGNTPAVKLIKQSNNQAFIHISAAKKLNIEPLRNLLYDEIARIHAIRYPYNNFLY